jgi:TrmH family RNA methyltransferase
MLSNNQQKWINSLHVKKYRQKYRKFLVEGVKMAEELLQQSEITLSAIYGTERWAMDHRELLAPFLDKFNEISETELKKISSLATPNQVLLVADLPDQVEFSPFCKEDICFYIDGIQDPGNLGTILRIADWFGFPAVYCSPDTVDAFSPKVIQSCMGAFLRVKIVELPLSDILRLSVETPVIGAVLDGDNVFETVLPSKGLLVIGREGRGLSPEVLEQLTHKIRIPRHQHGGAESLNAGVAAGILAAMLRR